MAYSAVELSKYIITKCARENKPISNLQLQKILYFIQKEYLQKKGVPAFNDPIEAWRFGPVVPESYYFFCGAGAMPITDIYDDFCISPADAELIDKIAELGGSHRAEILKGNLVRFNTREHSNEAIYLQSIWKIRSSRTGRSSSVISI